MGQLQGLKLARRPPRLDTFTDIQAPSVKRERVNGKNKYTLTPAKPGTITIFSDNENGEDRSSGSRAIKRERSQIPSRAAGHRHRPSQPRVKQERSPDRHGRQQSHGQSLPFAIACDTRQTQVHEPPRQRGAHRPLSPPSDSSSSSDSSGSDSSDSSGSEDESGSSSDSSSSDGSSSGDEASASVYRPSTPASSIWSSPAQNRRQKDTDVRAASGNPGTASPARRSAQSRASLGSGHTPIEFCIDVRSRPLSGRSEQGGRSRSQASSAAVPTGAQTERTARPIHHRPTNSSPVVLGFMPINRGSPTPKNAPTEPRAMRTGGSRPADTPSRAPQRLSIPVSGPVSGSSSLPFRGLPLLKDNSQQKDQQRRGPARPGRIMQTIEQPPVEISSVRVQPKNVQSSSQLRAATPGPSSRLTAPPQPSPGISVTPRAVSVRPCPVPRSQDSLQSVSRSRGKRNFDETECTDSTSEAVELERMLERLISHEKEMEQQRAQLEDTKRLLAEHKTRIDDLEQRRRVREVVRDPGERARTEERDVSPHPTAVARNGATLEAAPRDVSPPQNAVPRDAATPAVTVPQHLAPRRDSCYQSKASNRNRQRKASRMARIRLREQERQRLEQERQEDLELEQQLEQEQRRAAERVQAVVRRPQNNTQQAPPQSSPRAQAAAQKRIQHEVFSRPLSGHNPEMTFDDDDRPFISEATAFLMRLPQTFVLSKLRKLVQGKPFFDVAHPSSVHMGCWVVSSKRGGSCDMRMKLTDSGETHGFSFARLAVRLWHDAASIYSLVEHHKNRQKAVHTCHNEQCMHPEHIVVEPSSAAAERRRCKREGWCPGHQFVHKDGTRQARKPCIFAPQGAFIRR